MPSSPRFVIYYNITVFCFYIVAQYVLMAEVVSTLDHIREPDWIPSVAWVRET